MENLDLQPTSERKSDNIRAIKRSLILPVIIATLLFGITGRLQFFVELANINIISDELMVELNEFTQSIYFAFFYLAGVMLSICTAITLKDFSKIAKKRYRSNSVDYIQLGFYLLSIIYSIQFIALVVLIQDNIILGYELPYQTFGILNIGAETLSVIAWGVLIIGFLKLIKLKFNNLVSKVALILAITGCSISLLLALLGVPVLSYLYFQIEIFGGNILTIYNFSSVIYLISVPLLFIALPMFYCSLKSNAPKAPKAPKIQKNTKEEDTELDEFSLDLDKF